MKNTGKEKIGLALDFWHSAFVLSIRFWFLKNFKFYYSWLVGTSCLSSKAHICWGHPVRPLLLAFSSGPDIEVPCKQLSFYTRKKTIEFIVLQFYLKYNFETIFILYYTCYINVTLYMKSNNIVNNLHPEKVLFKFKKSFYQLNFFNLK